MGEKIIPTRYVYTCDACGEEESGPSKMKYPVRWCRISTEADYHDYQGAAVAADNTSILLCAKCGSRVRQAIGNAIVSIRNEGVKE